MDKKDELRIEDRNLLQLPLLAMRDLVIFPKTIGSFDVGRKQSIQAIERAQAQDGRIFLLAQKDPSVDQPEIQDLYQVGTVCAIKQVMKLPGGLQRILVEGLNRGQFLEEEIKDLNQVEVFPGQSLESKDQEEAYSRLLKEDLNQLLTVSPRFIPELYEEMPGEEDLEVWVDQRAYRLDLSLEDKQGLLEEGNLKKRLDLFHEILLKEVEITSLKQSIDYQVKESMDKIQRDYVLNEQMKVLKKELSGKDEVDLLDEYREKLEKKDLPEEVLEKAKQELKKLEKMNPAAPDYNVLINYLDWILDLPWTEVQDEEIDLKRARKILDEEHYGLKDVKERILEFIALHQSNPQSKGPILCLVGPPGVGKTSIVRSIAKALDKSYVRMSLGGVTDEAEIRGHRRTYVGALPGRIISLMKKAGNKNPVFLLDEIDKVGSDYRGDPASGLLEVLDPEQNISFTDRYMELPFDLSQVFFVTTANTVATIPPALKDRMEVIELSGYTPREKKMIAKKYLVPKLIADAGLVPGKVKISDAVLEILIENYTREAGVRSLEKEIAALVRKALLKMKEEDVEAVSISKRNLEDFAGPKKFLLQDLSNKNEIGIVTGLAWTQVGGVTLSIEVNITPGKGKVNLTGKLGEVMKESAMTAYSYLLSRYQDQEAFKDFRYSHDIHIHIPEGAVPKDGPSAGITLATALYSAITKRPVSKDVAMTGEITLRGKVLAIGGLKEKLLAASRMGIKKVLIPKENEKDLARLDEDVCQNLDLVLVDQMDQVLDQALED